MGTSRAINSQADAITTLTNKVQNLANCPAPAYPTKSHNSITNNKQLPKPTLLNASKKDNGKKKNTTIINEQAKFYVEAVKEKYLSPSGEFTSGQGTNQTVSQALFQPTYNCNNVLVIIETSGTVTEGIIDDNRLKAINTQVAHYNIRFHSVQCSIKINVTVETKDNIAVDSGVALAMEIALALDMYDIKVEGIYSKDWWTSFVIPVVPSHIGTNKSKELSTSIAAEIKADTSSPSHNPCRG